MHIAPAKGWPDGGAPQPMAGLSVTPFARGLEHPRWVVVLPNGDVLVAESDKPAPEGPPPDDGWVKKVRNWVMGKVMARAGSGNPSANRITLLRDADGDGVAETRSAFLQGLHSPFGMALVGSEFYVANTDAVVRFPYAPGQTAIAAAPAKVVDLPLAAAQPSLDQEPHRQPRWCEAVCHGRLQQQRGRERHGGGSRPRGHLGSRSRHGRAPRLRERLAQPQWHGLGAGLRQAVDRGE